MINAKVRTKYFRTKIPQNEMHYQQMTQHRREYGPRSFCKMLLTTLLGNISFIALIVHFLSITAKLLRSKGRVFGIAEATHTNFHKLSILTLTKHYYSFLSYHFVCFICYLRMLRNIQSHTKLASQLNSENVKISFIRFLGETPTFIC